MQKEVDRRQSEIGDLERAQLLVQVVGAIFLVAALVLHIAEVYLVGLMLLILLASGNGKSEHDLGEAAREGAPFVFVLVIFFGIVAMIHTQHLFAPVNDLILLFEGKERLLAYYIATGALSSISDNVFVASLFIGEAANLHAAGSIGREEYELIAVAINMGTNVPVSRHQTDKRRSCFC